MAPGEVTGVPRKHGDAAGPVAQGGGGGGAGGGRTVDRTGPNTGTRVPGGIFRVTSALLAGPGAGGERYRKMNHMVVMKVNKPCLLLKIK